MDEATREKLNKRLILIERKIEKKSKRKPCDDFDKLLQEAKSCLDKGDYDGCEKRIKELESHFKKMKKVLLGLGITVFLLFSFFLYIFYKNNITMLVSCVAVILYSLVFIPFAFCNLLSPSNQSEKTLKQSKINICYYNCLHIIYVLLPVALVGQVLIDNNRLCFVVLTLAISMCNLFILCKCCKDLIEKHITHLRYSNKLMTAIFSFLITLLCLFCKDMKIEFALLLIQPLVGLLILYEKIGVSIEETKKTDQNTAQDISGADDGAKKGD